MDDGTRRGYVKEAFALLAKINSSVVQEHQSFLNNDITPKQLLILRTVKDAEKITVNQLSHSLSMSPSSVSQIINRLEKDTYIKREINLENRREIYVTLDKEGMNLFKQFQQVDEHIIENYYSEFSLEEVKIFRDLVKKLYTTIRMKENRKDGVEIHEWSQIY